MSDKAPQTPEIVDLETFKLMREDEDFEIVPHCNFAKLCAPLSTFFRLNSYDLKTLTADVLVVNWQPQGHYSDVHANVQGWNRIPTN
jgi:hypothetical protein